MNLLNVTWSVDFIILHSVKSDESLIYRRRTEEFIAYNKPENNMYRIAVNPSCISKAVGHKRSNIEYFRKWHTEIKFIGDSNIPVYEVGEVK